LGTAQPQNIKDSPKSLDTVFFNGHRNMTSMNDAIVLTADTPEKRCHG